MVASVRPPEKRHVHSSCMNVSITIVNMSIIISIIIVVVVIIINL